MAFSVQSRYAGMNADVQTYVLLHGHAENMALSAHTAGHPYVGT